VPRLRAVATPVLGLVADVLFRGWCMQHRSHDNNKW